MEKILEQIDEMILNSKNIPSSIKRIVKAICKGYVRESNGLINISGVENVCNAIYISIEENNHDFTGSKKIMGTTLTNYDNDCHIYHEMSFINYKDYIKLITILLHELGHVITESRPCIKVDKYYPIVKKTLTLLYNCYYDNKQLMTNKISGFCMTDGFLEMMAERIFVSEDFRKELLMDDYDLKDYIYKDERLFPSRVYDEYKNCFKLFDYIMDGALSMFSCINFKSNEDISDYVEKHRLNIIFDYLDKSNDSLWALKDYEGKNRDEKFLELLNSYFTCKIDSLNLAYALLPFYNKREDDEQFKVLYNTYAETLKKQKLLPLTKEDFQQFESLRMI